MPIKWTESWICFPLISFPTLHIFHCHFLFVCYCMIYNTICHIFCSDTFILNCRLNIKINSLEFASFEASECFSFPISEHTSCCSNWSFSFITSNSFSLFLYIFYLMLNNAIHCWRGDFMLSFLAEDACLISIFMILNDSDHEQSKMERIRKCTGLPFCKFLKGCLIILCMLPLFFRSNLLWCFMLDLVTVNWVVDNIHRQLSWKLVWWRIWIARMTY